MNNNKFKAALESFDDLNYSQLKKVKSKISAIEENKEVSIILDTEISKIFCPHCKTKDIYKWGRQTDLQRYKCKKCNKTFNSLTGTPLAKLKKRQQWLKYSKCLILGRTIRKSATFCNIAKSTSFRWRHRFLKGSNLLLPNSLNGIVEIIDQTQKISFKGSKNIPDNPKIKNKLITLIFLRNRDGKTFNSILNDFNLINLNKKVKPILPKDSLFCSDKKEIYLGFTKAHRYRHGYIDTSKKIFVKKEIIHINNIAKYQNDLNKWMLRFRGVATKYLKNYLSWYRGLESFNMKPSVNEILLRAKFIN